MEAVLRAAADARHVEGGFFGEEDVVRQVVANVDGVRCLGEQAV